MHDNPVVLIFCFRFQELDLSKNAYLFSESSREGEWLSRIQEALQLRGNYIRVCFKTAPRPWLYIKSMSYDDYVNIFDWHRYKLFILR